MVLSDDRIFELQHSYDSPVVLGDIYNLSALQEPAALIGFICESDRRLYIESLTSWNWSVHQISTWIKERFPCLATLSNSAMWFFRFPESTFTNDSEFGRIPALINGHVTRPHFNFTVDEASSFEGAVNLCVLINSSHSGATWGQELITAVTFLSTYR